MAWNMPCIEQGKITMNIRPLTLVTALAAISAVWTAPGETSDPLLAARELPLDILKGCAPQAAACLEAREFASRWIGRTPDGNLFLVLHTPCTEANECRTWVVEKTARGASTLLTLNGEYHLSRGTGAFPSIQLRTVLNESQNHHARYEWRDSRYVRTDSRVVFRIDGAECGTQDECHESAREAMRRQQVDRAVKIWERVHGVSWI
jgi:hypothetical protein